MFEQDLYFLFQAGEKSLFSRGKLTSGRDGVRHKFAARAEKEETELYYDDRGG